ncbi:hypothetical protein niasHT_004518 [Heterodera trifolii]|uniref:B30.2/SPRY domain-containing protein n=1 Tax=Heterodera trifolii TaxID=157864 RepID=A0ABD2M073_9BILA
MSLSIGSSSSEDDFTADQPQITAEVNGPSITSWTIATENPTERKAIEEELKQQKVIKEQQKKKNEKYVSADQFAALLARVIELKEEQKQQKVKEKGTTTTTEKHGSVDQFIKIRNDHFLKRISELEKQQLKQRKQQQDEYYDNEYDSEQFTEIQLQNDQQQKIFSNYWDANFCHSDLEIIGTECLTVRHNGDVFHGYRSVCAKHPIFLLENDQNDSANRFYFEISIQNMKDRVVVGFIAQKQMALDEYTYVLDGTYAWISNGILWKNGSHTIGTDKECKYGAGDTVGCGIDLAKRKIYFTKNGIRLDSADLRVYLSIPSDVGQLFPFISLCDSDDKIETNFGPNFMPISPTTSKILPTKPGIVSTMLTTMTTIISPINLALLFMILCWIFIIFISFCGIVM